MKEHPILFSTQMVQAILEDRKTMTRRVIKVSPESIYKGLNTKGRHEFCDFSGGYQWIKSVPPKYKVGDILWVRETHYRYGVWKKNGLSKAGKQKWKFHADKQFAEVRYFDNPPEVIQKKTRSVGWYKRSSLFMPKWACRLYLEITDIKIECLRDISGQDAILEGIESAVYEGKTYYKDYIEDKTPKDGIPYFPSRRNPVISFQTLWGSINTFESWKENPWVWVLSFRKIVKQC